MIILWKNPFTYIEEVEEAIKSSKNNKACGFDQITAETLTAVIDYAYIIY